MNRWHSVHYQPPAEHAARSILAAVEDAGGRLTQDQAGRFKVKAPGALLAEIRPMMTAQVRAEMARLVERGPRLADQVRAAAAGQPYAGPGVALLDDPPPAGYLICPYCQVSTAVTTERHWPRNQFRINHHAYLRTDANGERGAYRCRGSLLIVKIDD